MGQAWWNSGWHPTTRPPRRATGTCTNSSSSLGHLEHRRQNLYDTHPERLDAQGFPQPAPPALPPGQGQEALLQGPPLDTTTAVQQRGSSNADGAVPDCTNCRVVAWTAACRHLTRTPRNSSSTGQLSARHCSPQWRPSPSDPWRCGWRACCPRPLPGYLTLPTSRNAHRNGAPHGGAAVRHHGGAAGRPWGELCPPPRPAAGRG